MMKRGGMGGEDAGDKNMMKKKMKLEEEEEVEEEMSTGFMNLDENLLYEVLRHVDARTLGTAACVSKQWHKTAQDERLWELICTRHWANIGCANHQLRSVVLALGGFRRLHSLYIWPLSKPPSSSAACSVASSSLVSPSPSPWRFPGAPVMAAKPSSRLSKDEIHLSLSLFSIRYYEKMNLGSRSGKS